MSIEKRFRAMDQRAQMNEARQPAVLFDALDAFPIVAFLALPTGLVTNATHFWYEFAGVSPSATLGDEWLDSIEPAQREALRERWFVAVAGIEPFVDEAHVRLANGTYRRMLLNAAPSRDPRTARVEAWLVSLTDIDAKHRMEQERSIFTSLAENSNDFIAIASLAGEVTFVNEAGRALLEIGALENALGRDAQDYFLPEDRAYVREVIFPTLARDGRWAGDFRFRNFRSGASVAIWYNVFFIRDALTDEPVAIAERVHRYPRTHARRTSSPHARRGGRHADAFARLRANARQSRRTRRA